MFKRLWITRIFADEFGFSDLRSNYSRVYSWMANQLGHMTLGLALTLFFFWVHNTIEAALTDAPRPALLTGMFGAFGVGAAIYLFRAGLSEVLLRLKSTVDGLGAYALQFLFVVLAIMPFAGVLVASGRDGMEADESPIIGVLLCIGVAIIAGGILLLGYLTATKEDKALDPKAPISGDFRGYAPVTSGMRRMGLGLVLSPLLITLGTWLAGLYAPPAGILATIVASTIYGLIVLFLSRDLRFALLGLFALGGAALIAFSKGLPHVPLIGVEREVLAFPGAALFWIATLLLIMVWRLRASWFDMFFYFTWGLALSFVFWWLVYQPPDVDWDLARAGAVASMTVWAVKEFSSDLPNVFDELADVEKKRPKIECEGFGVVADNGKDLSRDYVDTAMWDVRTDAAFYLAGAWIGAGVLTDRSLLFGEASWVVGTELVGLLIFGFFFIAGGANWAFRQKAIDQSGAARGNLLAVVPFATELWSLSKTGLKEPLAEPREKLRVLACGAKAARAKASRTSASGEDPWHVDHLLVVGPPRLCQQFADAMATEAVLSDLPPHMFAGLGKEDTWRRARKLDLALLERYEITNLTKAELPYTPIWDIDYCPRKSTDPVRGDDDKPPLERRTIVARQPTDRDTPDIPSADLALVTGYLPNNRDIRQGLRTIFGNTRSTRVKTVVWTFANARSEATEPKLTPKIDPAQAKPHLAPPRLAQPTDAAEERAAELTPAQEKIVSDTAKALAEQATREIIPWPDKSDNQDERALAQAWACRFQSILDHEMAGAAIDLPQRTKLAVVILRANDAA